MTKGIAVMITDQVYSCH